MKEYLLDFLRTASELDFDKLPNVIFMRHLKDELEIQVEDFGLLPGCMDDKIDVILGHIDVNFSALGTECSEEDDEYLRELAKLTAKCIWKMYGIVGEFSEGVFLNQVKRFSLSLT